MTRSLYKGPYTEYNLLHQLKNSIVSTLITTKSRSSTITSLFVNRFIGVYNGKEYVYFQITREMVGHKLGEFVPTKKKVVFKKKKRKKR